MASNGNSNNRDNIELPSARTGLDAFLGEIATEFGIPDYFRRDKGDFPARIHGYIGGNSVRAFSYFAQNFLKALSPEQGALLLKEYGMHIPQSEKDRVNEYLKQINYKPMEETKNLSMEIGSDFAPSVAEQIALQTGIILESPDNRRRQDMNPNKVTSAQIINPDVLSKFTPGSAMEGDDAERQGNNPPLH